MAQVRVRHASMYVGGKKIGEMFNNKYSMNSGDEPQYGDDGFEGMSDGAITTNVTCTTITPVTGMSVNLVNALLQKADVDVAIGTLDNHIHQVTMRCTKAEFTSDAKAGTLNGDFEFMGGVPKVV